jgi:hypothetical protein
VTLSVTPLVTACRGLLDALELGECFGSELDGDCETALAQALDEVLEMLVRAPARILEAAFVKESGMRPGGSDSEPLGEAGAKREEVG